MRIIKCIKSSALAIALLSVGLLSPQPGKAGSETEQLIVFLQPGASPVDETFQKRHLPKIRKLAAAMGVSVHSIDANQGSPAEIAITPLIVYQNYLGRSIYQGRSTTIDRIRNFIRTSRFVPQGLALNRREHIPIWKNGRIRVWAPLKVSAVRGTPPEGYDHAVFVSEALKIIGEGFNNFRIEPVAELGRADRGFYMDFYPWLSQGGTLYLSLALYSQFNCKYPVFERKKEPLIGSWKDRQRLFREAAVFLETAVLNQIRDPESGDGFDPVMSGVASTTWEKLGFPLPPAPMVNSNELTVQPQLSRAWILEKSGPLDPPMIQFRFPAPLDSNAGEVTDGRGEFLLPKNFKVEGAKGFIEIDTSSAITMGDPVLDEAIRGSVMLSTKRYPKASFFIESITGDNQPIAYGRLTPANISGTFTLKGKSTALTSIAELEPVIGDDGKSHLLIRGAFKIDLRTFNIEGADGPAPAKYTLLFDFNFIFKAKA
jgi:polyisoprenoid-binding protein YceI